MEVDVDVCDDSRLIVGELVEVRKIGSRICWLPARIVDSGAGIRVVEYESGGKESIPLGSNCDEEAGTRVRPLPPQCSTMCHGEWKRGLRVEAFGDSWREGLLMEAPGIFSTHAEVFFPDDGDKMEFRLDQVRVSQAWDAATNGWSVRGCENLDWMVDTGSAKFKKPQRTFQRKKKRVADENLEAASKKAKKENGGAEMISFDPNVQVKQECVSDGIQTETVDSSGLLSPTVELDVKAEAIEPDWMEEGDFKQGNLLERTFQPDGDGEGYCLTKTMPIPVCCINTQSEDALFVDEQKVSEDDRVDASYNDRALLDSSSQGSFHSTRDVNERNRLYVSQILKKKQKLGTDYSRRDEPLKAARENAIKYLEESGWKKGYRERHRESRVSNEAYYISPDGTSYHSLTSACKAWIQQKKDVTKAERDAIDSYRLQVIVRRKPGEVLPDVNGGKRRLRPSRKLDSSSKPKKSERPRLSALLLAPARGKQDGEDEKVNRRTTIFSWLIDAGVVSENIAVSYVNKDTQAVARGTITRDGISCKCCNEVFSMPNFQIHAGNDVHRTAAQMTLEDGRSLLDCEKQALKKMEETKCDETANGQINVDESDECCGLCGEGGELICCDHCPATFHLHCILLKSLPEGDWFCPKCRCPVCGAGQFDGREVLCCTQCERSYHIDCLNNGGEAALPANRFCSQSCKKIFCGLRELVGVSSPMDGGFTWTLLRSAECDEETDLETVTEHSSKIALALSVMRECFSPMIDPRRKIDIISHILKNRSADVKRLDFRGFYTFLLENKGELISVAAVRVHGTSIAEMPLIGTRLQYRRQGMCRRLLEVIEQVLRSLDVHTLVLPAVPELMDTWIGAFGFQKVSPFQSVRLLELSIVGFPGTKVLHKPLTWLNLCRKIAPPLAERPWAAGSKLHMGLDPEPRRKPKQQKPKVEETPKEVETPVPVLSEPGQALALVQAEVVPGLKEESTEDSRIIVAKTRSNRLVKTSKKVAEALKTLTNKKFQRPEAADPAEEPLDVENNSELSFLKLGSSHIAIENAELAAAPTASGSEIVELASSNNETREESSGFAMVLDQKEILEQHHQAGIEMRSDELVLVSKVHGKKCVTCGTSETPMWRKDPGGIKHLCNACGIRLKKKRLAEHNQNSMENVNWEYEEEDEC